jgi:hypothetical protein
VPGSLTQTSYEFRLLSNNQYLILASAPFTLAGLPVVTVAAANANVSEAAGTATFNVSRSGSTAAALPVSYTVNGTATLGQDWTEFSGSYANLDRRLAI